MRLTISLIMIVVFIFLLNDSENIVAQSADTVYVSALPPGNINNFINGDTTANGARVNPNRVYVLHRDSIYFYTGSINANFKLTLMAEKGNGALPVIAPAILQDGSKPVIFINLQGGGLTLNQLYLFGISPDEKPAPGGRALWVTGDSMKIHVNKCIFDGWNFGAIFNRGNWNSYWITDNVFRNMMDYRSWFWGDSFFSYGGFITDTLYIVNNTIFNCEGYAFVSVYYNHYTVFDHNTVFLNGINPMYSFNLTNAKITNNIFYGMVSQGQRKVEIEGGWFDNGDLACIVPLDTLRRVHADFGITEDQRYVTVSNNAYFWPQGILNTWKTINDTASSSADSVFAPLWMNKRTVNMFADKNTWPHLEASNNMNIDPGFDQTLVDATVNNLSQYILLNRTGKLGTYLWWYKPSGFVYPPTQPLPENLAYSNLSLQHAGTDGYALGDLNWFPSQHEQWSRRTTGVESNNSFAQIPEEFSLSNAYPNPFNPSTNISFTIPESGNVRLIIYNMLGEKIKTLVDAELKAGSYYAKWDGKDDFGNQVSSGIYFYRLESGSFIAAKKMVLMK